VLCLLPYLVLSVAAAAHNHGLSLSVVHGQTELSAAFPCADHTVTLATAQAAEPGVNAVQANQVDSNHAANEVCLACQWSTNSSNGVATPVALDIPTASESRVTLASHALPCIFAIATPNRGPPSV
jgi:hypothetical protein